MDVDAERAPARIRFMLQAGSPALPEPAVHKYPFQKTMPRVGTARVMLIPRAEVRPGMDPRDVRKQLESLVVLKRSDDKPTVRFLQDARSGDVRVEGTHQQSLKDRLDAPGKMVPKLGLQPASQC